MKALGQRVFLLFIYSLLYFPLLVLILYSVNNTRYSLQWHGFSWQWYQELFYDRDLWAAFFNSVILGLAASFIATTIGILSCVQLFLYSSKQQKTITTLLLLQIIIPDLVLGVSLLIFFNVVNIHLGFLSLLIAHVTFCLPFAVLTINVRIRTLDPTIYYSALDLGAGCLYALTHVLLPLLWPAILSAFLLSFTLSFDDVIISYFVAGPSFTILPLTIYSLVRTGITPELNALCSITLIISIVLVFIAHYLSRRTI